MNLLLFLLIAVPLANAQESKPPESGFVSLFDGKSLAGWTGAKDAYTVENGAIVCVSGSTGNLLTEKEFSDFVLRFEFKLTAGANNGLGIRCPMQPKGNLHIDGIELQILDDTAEKYQTLKPYQYHGSVYGIHPAKREQAALNAVGKWNSQEVVVQGRAIKVVLNNKTIVDCDLDESTKNGTMDGVGHPGLKRSAGHIGFLGHGDRVEFRNIRLKDLSKRIVERPDVESGALGGLRFLRDVYRLSLEELHTGPGMLPRLSMCHTLRSCTRERIQYRLEPHLPYRPVRGRSHGVARSHAG